MTGRVRFGRQMMKLLQQTVRNYFIVLGQAYTSSNLNSIQFQYFKFEVSSSTPHSWTTLLCIYLAIYYVSRWWGSDQKGGN